nr:MAG TPA: hypothetical protein [Caudoviricetes sp.]
MPRVFVCVVARRITSFLVKKPKNALNHHEDSQGLVIVVYKARGRSCAFA